VWPEEGEKGRYWCRQCDRKGDAIQFLIDYRGMPFTEARDAIAGGALPDYMPAPRSSVSASRTPSLLRAPNPTWQARAMKLAEESAHRIWTSDGARALDYLRRRGFTDEVISIAGFGYHPEDTWRAPSVWGLDQTKRVFMPRGITIPWMYEGEIWRLNVRRPAGNPKYIGPAGSSNGLYLGEGAGAGLPVMMVEGEFDTWSVQQAAPGIVRAVATGSATGSRHAKWIARLWRSPLVLVAFDTDSAGESAADFWCKTLHNTLRWAPIGHDVNAMLTGGLDILAWVRAGIGAAQHGRHSPRMRPGQQRRSIATTYPTLPCAAPGSVTACRPSSPASNGASRPDTGIT